MVIPDSLVLVLLTGAFALSGIAYYRMIGLANQSNFGWPFVVALLAMLSAVGFLALLTIWPDWGLRKPVVLVLSVGLLVAGIATFRFFGPRAMG